ncbi:MAG: hypothetical protein KDC38_05075 [Planctomycetes bacterium]|nr:hypothetical protein [Planctomycetota bacterium]
MFQRTRLLILTLALISLGTLGVDAQSDFVRGDTNGNGVADIADVIGVLSYLFLSVPVDCIDACDTSDDGAVDIADPVQLLGFLFQGGSAPPPPFPGCGNDPTSDGLDCIGPVSACGPGIPSCAEAELTLGVATTGSLSGASDTLFLGCGDGGGVERGFLFAAPTDGTYRFTTEGSNFDTILALYATDCVSEITCNDDTPSLGVLSEIVYTMTAGEEVVVIISGYGGAAGDFVLAVAPPGSSLPTISVGDVVSGSTVGLSDDYSLSCVPNGAGDDAFEFTAPTTGTFAFDTAGSAYDTALGIFAAGGVELACNDDFGTLQSRVTVSLIAGETVEVAVDGYDGLEGDYVLSATETVNCAAFPVAVGAPAFVGSTVGEADDFGPVGTSCGGFGSAVADAEFAFSAPVSGRYTIDTIGSSFDTVLRVFSADCLSMIACDHDEFYFSLPTYRNPSNVSSVTVDLTAGQAVLIVVDGNDNGDEGNFTLNIREVPDCVFDVIGLTAANGLPSSTIGQSDDFQSCASFSSGAPDIAYAFTAPETASYAFAVLQATLSPDLYFYDETCANLITCSNGYESMAIDLEAGETVVVVIDGGASGGATDFELHTYMLPEGVQGLTYASAAPSIWDTTAESDKFNGLCGAAGVPDVGYFFIPTTTGSHVVKTYDVSPVFSTDFDTVVRVLWPDGTNEFWCDDTEVSYGFSAGAARVLVLDGATASDFGPSFLYVIP